MKSLLESAIIGPKRGAEGCVKKNGGRRGDRDVGGAGPLRRGQGDPEDERGEE